MEKVKEDKKIEKIKKINEQLKELREELQYLKLLNKRTSSRKRKEELGYKILEIEQKIKNLKTKRNYLYTKENLRKNYKRKVVLIKRFPDEENMKRNDFKGYLKEGDSIKESYIGYETREVLAKLLKFNIPSGKKIKNIIIEIENDI